MAAFERFEDIDAWRRSRELARDVYAATNTGAFARDYGLRDQIRRAAVSVMSNIAEGFERYGSIEFRRFLSIAKGSAGEVKSQLYVALDAGLIGQSSFEQLYEKADAVSQLVGGLMRYLSQDVQGHGGSPGGHKNSERGTLNAERGE